MKKFLFSIVLTTFVLAPCAAISQTAMSPSTVGVGPSGFDWAVGTWACTNSMPSPMGGPATQTLTVTKTNGGAIMYHAVGANFDNTWYNVYVPATKSWKSPFIINDGTYGTESTTQTGATIVWNGSATDPTGKTLQVRDTNTLTTTKYTDLGEVQSGGVWKPQYKMSCTKS
ncbi:MAG: hypothetical protein JO322_16735 [Candidatus Eremiobacteraeota bacterium]|nr:hypothetical protein [Candidatus Eremiobacteraeota bacterium]